MMNLLLNTVPTFGVDYTKSVADLTIVEKLKVVVSVILKMGGEFILGCAVVALIYIAILVWIKAQRVKNRKRAKAFYRGKKTRNRK